MANQPLFYNQTQTQRRITSIHRAPKLSEGIYLVKRKGMKSPVYDHYGFAVSGKYLKSFNLSGDTAKVIHKDDTGVIQNDFAPFSWQIVHRMPENEISLAIIRTKMTLNDKYNLLFDNCEHFARYVTTGKKESSQVQNVSVLGGVAALAYFLLQDNG